MMYFGQFLIDKGVLSREALLRTLMEQIAMSPSPAEIVFSETLLPLERQLAVLARQSELRCSYGQACQAEGVWTAELERLIEIGVRKARPALEELLVKKSRLDAGVLVAALEDYVRQGHATSRSAGNDASFLPQPLDGDCAESEEEPVSHAAILVAEFARLFDEAFVSRLRAVLSGTSGAAPGNGALRDAIGQLRMLQAAAESLKLPYTRSLAAAACVRLVAIASNHERSLSPGDALPGGESLSKCVELLWQLRTELVTTGSETGVADSNGALAARCQRNLYELQATAER